MAALVDVDVTTVGCLDSRSCGMRSCGSRPYMYLVKAMLTN